MSDSRQPDPTVLTDPSAPTDRSVPADTSVTADRAVPTGPAVLSDLPALPGSGRTDAAARLREAQIGRAHV